MKGGEGRASEGGAGASVAASCPPFEVVGACGAGSAGEGGAARGPPPASQPSGVLLTSQCESNVRTSSCTLLTRETREVALGRKCARTCMGREGGSSARAGGHGGGARRVRAGKQPEGGEDGRGVWGGAAHLHLLLRHNQSGVGARRQRQLGGLPVQQCAHVGHHLRAHGGGRGRGWVCGRGVRACVRWDAGGGQSNTTQPNPSLPPTLARPGASFSSHPMSAGRAMRSGRPSADTSARASRTK